MAMVGVALGTARDALEMILRGSEYETSGIEGRSEKNEITDWGCGQLAAFQPILCRSDATETVLCIPFNRLIFVESPRCIPFKIIFLGEIASN